MSRKSQPIAESNFPDREPADYPAPSGPRFVGRTLLDSMRAADGLPPRTLAYGLRVSHAETLSRARAAAAAEIPHSWDRGGARLECAADIAAAELIVASRETDGATDCPRAERVRLTALRWRARDWREAAQTRREHLADLDATERVADGSLSPALVTERTPGLPLAAAVKVADALADRLNLPAARVLFFDALRDGDGESKAAELDFTHGSYRNACSRGRAALLDRFPEPRELLAALSLADSPDAGTTVGSGAGWVALGEYLTRRHFTAWSEPRAVETSTDIVLACIVAERSGQLRMALPTAGARDAESRWQALRAVRADRRYARADANAGNGLTANR